MMSLSFGYGSSNWREEMWIEIFDRARRKNKVVKAQIGQHDFEYALINSKDGYGRLSVSTTCQKYRYRGELINFWIKDEESSNSIGTNEGGFAFVFQRTLPRIDFADYVGLHEYIEAIEGKHKHGLACRVELE